MTIDPGEFRTTLGNFATGVTIITSRTAEGDPLGMTANSFSSVSLDPPLVLFSMDRRAMGLRNYQVAGHFAVNILARDQEHLSGRFARTAGDKWAGIQYETWQTGSPILSGALANFDCRLWQSYDGGDHVIFVGEVVQNAFDPDKDPLLFFRGRYGTVTSEHG